jgi:uncharacterized protein involved in exopolysaccharide biosynthesis
LTLSWARRYVSNICPAKRKFPFRGTRLQELPPYSVQRDYSAPLPFNRHDLWPLPGPVNFRFRNYWRFWRKHLRLIGAITLGVLLLCSLYLLTAARIYTASSTILIEPMIPATYGQDNEQGLVGAILAPSPERAAFKTQCNILQSQSLAAKVIRDLQLGNDQLLTAGNQSLISRAVSRSGGSIANLFQAWFGRSGDEPPRRIRSDAESDESEEVSQPLISAYLRRLVVLPGSGTSLVTLSFSSADPELSARVVNAHVQAYLAQQVELRDQANRNAQKYNLRQISQLKNDANKAENALNEYRHEHGAGSLPLQDPGEQLLHRLSSANGELNKVVAARMSLEAAHQLIEAKDYDSLPQVSNNSLIQSLKRQYAELASQYASMSNGSSTRSEALDDLKASLNDSQRRLDRELAA